VEAISPRIYSDRLDPSRPAYGDKNCLVLRFLAPDAKKGFKAPGHTRLLQAQLINQILKKRSNTSVDYSNLSYSQCCSTDNRQERPHVLLSHQWNVSHRLRNIGPGDSYRKICSCNLGLPGHPKHVARQLGYSCSEGGDAASDETFLALVNTQPENLSHLFRRSLLQYSLQGQLLNTHNTNRTRT
jgi:hypothetical protein